MTNLKTKPHNILTYIDNHLDDALDVATLSRIACQSPFHFQRQFTATYGISVAAYIKQLRLKRAAYQLAYRTANTPDNKVIDIALKNGFKSSEAFSRAFKQAIGQSPTEFRQTPDWIAWQQTQQPLIKLRTKVMQENTQDKDVQIIQFPEITLAVLEHRAAPEQLGESIRVFINWRKENRLPPSKSRTFNLIYDDPTAEHIIDNPNSYRFDLGAEITTALKNNFSHNPSIINKTIPNGKCAKIRHTGSDDTLGHSINYLYTTWLPQSQENPRDFPLFLERIRFFPEAPESQAITDIYLPLE